MVTLDKMLPSRKNNYVAIEKGYSRLLWLTLSLNVCLNKLRKTESEVLVLQKKLPHISNWNVAKNKITVWTPFGGITLSRSLS
jgi:hypothetical protein